MNKDLLLQLQAYLDNEVSASDGRQIAAMLSRDPEAQAIYNELRATKALLAENEPQFTVPESKDFYWSKIRRAIHQIPEERPVSVSATVKPWWTRLLVPASIAAVLAVVIFSLAPHQAPNRQVFGSFQEVETSDETSAISFFSEQHKMSVVWVNSQEN